jgi:hypothetical protein
MPLSPDHEDELLGMLDAMREGQLTVEDEERLSRWAIEDGEVCRFMVEYLDMCAVLEWKSSPLRARTFLLGGAASSTDPFPPTAAPRPRPAAPSPGPIPPAGQDPPREPPPAPTPGSHLPRWLVPSEVWLDAAPVVAFGVLLLAVGALAGYWASRREPGPAPAPQVADSTEQAPAAGPSTPAPQPPPVAHDPPPTNHTLATLVAAERCRLLGSGRMLAPRDRVNAGDRLEFSGAAELLFDDGARLAIEGASTLDVVAMRQVRLHAGCLVAHVPARARGFAVDVGDWDVVDIGTEFGVIVENNGAVEVHVLSGTVELVSANENEPPQPPTVRVQTGDARRLSSPTAGQWTPIRLSVDRFARLLEPDVDDTARPLPPIAPENKIPQLPALGWRMRLEENFQGAELDPARWFVVKPGKTQQMRRDAAPANARLAAGRMLLDNGCFLCTTDEFNPALEPVRTRIQWQVEEAGDCLGIMLRAGKPTEGVAFGFDLAVGGVRGFIDIHGAGRGPRLVLITQSGGGGTRLVQDAVPFDAPRPGELYEYEVLDDGNRVALTARRLAGARGPREATVAIDVPAANSPTHHTLVHNFVDNKDDRRTTEITSFTVETLGDQ